ncbi:MAG: monovalent cation/H+ antiporter complex subunit F [Actinomycetota bacterium]
MTGVLVACLAVLVLSVILVVTRVEQGPSMLDRAISIDVITAALMGFVAILSALTGRTDLVPLMAALALVGFLSTVTIARFAAAESDEERRILTREEMEELLAREPEFTDDDAPVHDVDRPAEGA